jgi:Asp-tRNA(Asn)/Glu-tRNA(Gln) amidotransferase A subunit family amidase
MSSDSLLDFTTVYPAPGVPFGLSFLGTAFSEFKLISYAFAYEQKTMTRYDTTSVSQPLMIRC